MPIRGLHSRHGVGQRRAAAERAQLAAEKRAENLGKAYKFAKAYGGRCGSAVVGRGHVSLLAILDNWHSKPTPLWFGATPGRLPRHPARAPGARGRVSVCSAPPGPPPGATAARWTGKWCVENILEDALCP
jgi:hypothetical protein